MGCKSSKICNDEWIIAQKKARKNYKNRVTYYDPKEHGSPSTYMRQITSQYNLECIPEHIRNGKRI